MSGSKSKGKAAAGGDNDWSRASEISDAMLGIQSYSDDSLMFLLRYGNQAKVRKNPNNNKAPSSSFPTPILTEFLEVGECRCRCARRTTSSL